MGRKPMIAGAAAVVAALVLGGLFAYLYDQSRRDVIAPGVRVAGIDVGGLHTAAAVARLRDRVQTPLLSAIVVSAGTRTFSLSPQRAGLAVDTRTLVDQALQASRTGSFLSRTVRGLTGGAVARDIPLSVAYSHDAVRSLIASISREISRPARDATIAPGPSGLQPVPGQTGTAVNASVLAYRIEHALADPAASRTISVPTHVVQPKVTEAELSSKYPTYIVVNRGSFELRFYDHLRLAMSFPIAVGMQGLETPPGLYSIQWKQTNPSWYVPNSAWAGALAGKTIPPGPQDPIKARWMAFDGGAGIHGIDPSEYSSIGHDASHGCIRMRIPDVIALYARTPVGTPVFIV
ncbi:MAG TPA: L,D-transpeptidase/peptidoglycan binding protein [Solirubrobacteraceae bacterium]|nr:L,D-transpeptidase/peptidoglycan binding protein [Solirubrobacteraceae bacterium]